MCSYLMLEIIFCFFKNESFLFLDEDPFQGEGLKFSKILRGVAHKGRGVGRFRIFLGGEGYPGGHYAFMWTVVSMLDMKMF